MDDRGWVVDTTRWPDLPVEIGDDCFTLSVLLIADDDPTYIKFDLIDRRNIRDFIIELVKEIERLQGENIALNDIRINLFNELKARQRIFVDTLKENSKLKATISDLADRLSQYETKGTSLGALMRGCQEGYYE